MKTTTISIGDFSPADAETIASIIEEKLRERDIEPISFSFSIEVELPLETTQQSVEDLRNAGFAVVVFTPDELKEADPEHVESRLVELGNDVIDCSQ